MKTLKWIFKHLLRIFTWGLCLLFSLILSLIDNLSLMDLIPFSLIIILIVSQIIYYYHKQNYKDIVKSITPSLYFLFFLCNFHFQWGNGHTNGILGYQKEIGILTLLNVSSRVVGVLYIASYILISMTIIFKYYLILDEICYNPNIPKIIITVVTLMLCVLNIIVHYKPFLLFIIFYYLGYLLFKSIYIIETWKD